MTSKLHISLLTAAGLLTLAVTACQAPAVTPAPATAPAATVIDAGEGGNGTAVITPRTSARHVLVASYTRSDIQSLLIELFRVSGSSETKVVDATLLASQLDRTLTFSHLKEGASYRVKATAFHDGQVISVASGSQADFTLDTIGNTSFTQVPVTLMGAPAASSAGVAPGLTVTDGGIAFRGFAGTLATGLVYPGGLVTDTDGHIYVADTGSGRILKVTPAGGVTTYANGVGQPRDVTRAPDGTLYVANGMGSIVKVSAATQAVTTLMNVPAADGVTLGPDGALYLSSGLGVMKVTLAGQASMYAPIQAPRGLSFDAQGQLYVVDGRHTLYRVSAGGTVTPVTSDLNGPYDVEVGPDGHLYVAEAAPGHRVSRVSPEGVVTPLAGNGTAASVDGLGLEAQFNGPAGITVDAQGHLYVGETYGNRIRKIF